MRDDRLPADLRVTVGSDGDLLSARQQARSLALQMGFPLTDVVGIVTALSEMARNMLIYAGRGELVIRPLEDGERRGIAVVARDEGPGIPDVEKAMLDGYSTSGGLGMGLPGIRRLMDTFQIQSALRTGTTVTAEKWLNHH